MRVVVGGIWHETNTFALGWTTVEDFRARGYHVGDALIQELAPTRTEIGGMLAGAAESPELVIVPTSFAVATPSGLVTAASWSALAGDLLGRIAAARPIDGVLLALHGAMAAEGCDDPEGNLLDELRRLVGPNVPIIATFDLHANVSAAMVARADALIGYDTCPHVDPYDRGVEAARLMARTLRGEVRPTMALAKPGIIVLPRAAWTERPPMAPLLAEAFALERDPRVLAVSIACGFPPADVACAGMSIVVTTNGDAPLAQEFADRLAARAWERRHEFVFRNYDVETGVRRAIAAPEGPVVVVDLGDSVGAGSTGDGTIVWAALLEHGAERAVIALVDPGVVDEAIRAGVGAMVDVAVGGKQDPRLGRPVPMRVRVRLISDGEFVYTGPYMTGQRTNTGRTVVLETSGGNRAIVSEIKTLPFDHEQLRSVGVSPEQCKIIVVKTAISWRAAYGHLAKEVIYVDTPGPASDDLGRFHFERVPRPIYPLDPE